jgi:hypothetical protein
MKFINVRRHILFLTAFRGNLFPVTQNIQDLSSQVSNTQMNSLQDISKNQFAIVSTKN